MPRLHPARAAFYLLFTLSGFAGLIYESIWTHYLKLFLGHAAYAQSLVLVVFMGGMAAGSAVCSRISARLRNPLAGYALVEAIVGLCAIGLHEVFVGVTDPIDPRVESPEEVRDRVLEAAEHIPLAQLGTTDDCGFAPFGDDTSTARDTAFEKIRARVAGTKLASQALGV